MKKFSPLLVVILILITGHASAQVAPEKRQAILHMLSLTGVNKSMDDLKLQLLNGLRAQMPNQPTEFWNKVETKINTNDLLEQLVKVYSKYYTLEEVNSIKAFYESPIGQKILSSQSLILDESARITQNWATNIRQEIQDESK